MELKRYVDFINEDEGDELPKKYTKGLTQKEIEKREDEFQKKKKAKGKDKYEPLETNKGEKTKESKHTKKFKSEFGTSEDLENPSDDPIENIIELVHKKLKIDKKKLKKAVEEIKDRGAEAWVTGHRPGATQHQWYLARIYSFFTKGTTFYETDRDIAVDLGMLDK